MYITDPYFRPGKCGVETYEPIFKLLNGYFLLNKLNYFCQNYSNGGVSSRDARGGFASRMS